MLPVTTITNIVATVNSQSSNTKQRVLPFNPASTMANINNSNRPMSAQLRRPSLDVIPENRRMLSHRVFDKNIEIELEEHDVNYISSSSYDPRHLPSASIILNPHSKKIGWISTGLLPQLLCIHFLSSWVYRKIVVRCFGADALSLSIPSMMNLSVPMERLNTNDFIFDVRISALPSSINRSIGITSNETDNTSDTLDRYWGNQLTLTFNKSSTQFVGVVGVKVVVVPHIISEKQKSQSISHKCP